MHLIDPLKLHMAAQTEPHHFILSEKLYSLPTRLQNAWSKNKLGESTDLSLAMRLRSIQDT